MFNLRPHLLPILLTLLFVHLAPAADDNTGADQQFTSISRLLERADQALEKNALQDAGRLYGATVRAYETFMQTFPAFAPDLVRFRIAYCRNQMAAIRQHMLRDAQEQATALARTNLTIHPPQPLVVPKSVLDALRTEDMETLWAMHRNMEEAGQPTAPLLQSALLVQEGDLAGARAVLEQFLAQFPAEPSAHYNMAQLLLRETQPDFEKARLHYRKAIDGGAPKDEDLEIVLNF